MIGNLETKWATPWQEGFNQYRKTLHERLETRRAGLKELTEQTERIRAEIETLNEHNNLINECSKLQNQYIPENKVCETLWLFQISKIEPLEDTKTKTKEETDTKKDKSTQIQISSANKVTSCSSNVFSCFLRVKSPLQICKSETFSLGQFCFRLHAKDVYHNCQWTLRIIINCFIADGTYPPTFDLRYKIRLINHADEKMSKNKEGIWNHPKPERLYWHPVSFSDITDSEAGWITKSKEGTHEFISIVLEVIEVK